MTHRFGISRKSDTTSSSQINNSTTRAQPKSADIDQFNAAMRAKTRQQEQQSESNTNGSTTRSSDHLTAQATTAGQLTQAHPALQSTVIQQHHPLHTTASLQQAPVTGGNVVALSLTLPGGSTTAIQQAVAVMHRIIQSHADNRTPKTWKLQLTLDDKTNITVNLGYHGKTDWSIGLLDEQSKQQTDSYDNPINHAHFIEELQAMLVHKHPTLRISAS